MKPISMKELKLAARRPRDSSLDTSKAILLGLAIPPQEECVKHFIKHYRSIAKPGEDTVEVSGELGLVRIMYAGLMR